MVQLTKEEKRERTDLIERYLKEGLPPPHKWREAIAYHSPTATSAAAKDLGIAPEGLRRQIKAKNIPEPDWSLWPGWPEAEPPVSAEEYRALELKLRRKEQDERQWKASKVAHQDEIIRLQDHRSILESVASIFRPPRVSTAKIKDGGAGGHTALIDISDIHFGASVSKREMDGLNSYSIKTCISRLRRMCKRVLYLMKKHMTIAFDEMVVLLKGDLISGGMFLHEETGRTDECQPVEQVTGVAEILSEVLMTWRKELRIPIRVYCVPGNHGRTTRKNEPSQLVANSLDIAACRFIEASFQHDPHVTFKYPESGEAVFQIYGFNVLAVHGHMMGSGGGGGVYGPAYTMIRGGMKTWLSYDRRGTRIDYIFIGHYHTSLRPLPFLYANGSIVGPDPYAMHKLKAIPEPAQQSLFVFHADLGIVDWREVKVGDPSEGSIYDTGAPRYSLDDRGEVVRV